EIDLLRVEEEALVESTGGDERVAADEHERADRPVRLELVVVAVEAQLALAEPAGASRHTLEAERVPERARRRRKVTHRRRQLAGRVDLSHARDSDACPPTHVGDERRERAIEHLGVRIEEEQPRRVARRRADVVRMRVAAVLADDDARVWEVALD